MGEKQSKESVPTATAATSEMIVHPIERIVQNFVLVWFDAEIDEKKQIYQDALLRFRSTVNDVKTFTQINPCVTYLREIKLEKAFVITSPSMGKSLLSIIHDLPQLNAVYIFSWENIPVANWMNEYGKVKGCFSDLKLIWKALQEVMKDCNQDSTTVSFVTVDGDMSNDDLNRLEPSFMYTQIIKEAIFDMDYDDTAIEILVNYCRQFYKNNVVEQSIIKEFQQSYRSKSPVWWYTRECFTYQMLNRALRLLEGTTIVNMGFFIRDIHNQLKELHQSQLPSYHGNLITLFRGQGLSTADFEKLQRSQGGLVSFNNFLSTSTAQKASMTFARRALSRTDTVGILFEMKVDPSVSSTPFASIEHVSFFNTEAEILFSMHSIFRVNNVTKLDPKTSLYQVDLELTAKDDEELRELTGIFYDESLHKKGYERLALAMEKVAQYDKAEELFNLLLDQPHSLEVKGRYYSSLASIKSAQGDSIKALEYGQQSVQIHEDIYSADDPTLATAYATLAEVYMSMNDYEKALPFYQDSLEILEGYQSTGRQTMIVYSNIAMAYDHLGDKEKALFYNEKSLNLMGKNLPPAHPDVAVAYGNLGSIYGTMGEYEPAIELKKKAVEIAERSLPENHPSLGIADFNLGAAYLETGEYTTAIPWLEKSLIIFQKALPSNHPHLAAVYNRLGDVYLVSRKAETALPYYIQAAQVFEQALPPNPSGLADVYKKMGMAYSNTDDNVKALVFHQKALTIYEQIHHPNHPELRKAYNAVASLYPKVGQKEDGIALAMQALDRQKEVLPSNHPDLAKSYHDIGVIYYNMAEYDQAITFYQKALEIRKEVLPADDPDLGLNYNNLAVVYSQTEDYTRAITFFHMALEISLKSSSDDHEKMFLIYKSLAEQYWHTDQHTEALEYYEKARIHKEKLHPENDKELLPFYGQLVMVYYYSKNTDAEIELSQKAIQILEANTPLDLKGLGTFYKHIALGYYKAERYDEAIEPAEKSLECYEQVFDDNDDKLAVAYDSTAKLYHGAEQFENALAAYERALEIWEKISSEDNENVVSTKRTINQIKQLIALQKLFLQ